MKQKYMNLVNKHSGNASQFANALRALGTRLGVPFEWIADVIYSESEFNPRAKNPHSSASGLIQFIEGTAQELGTTTSQILTKTNIQQLEYVEAYFKKWFRIVGKPKTRFDLYLCVFYPSWVNKSMTSTLAQNAYNGNKAIDFNKDGKITKAEFLQWFEKRVGKEEKIFIGASLLPFPISGRNILIFGVILGITTLYWYLSKG